MQTAASRRRLEREICTTVQTTKSPNGVKSNNSARHHASVRNRCFARLNTNADTRRKSWRHRFDREKNRRVAAATWPTASRDRPNRPGPPGNRNYFAPGAPRRSRRFARPNTTADSRRKSWRHRFARRRKPPIRGRSSGRISSRGMINAALRAWTQLPHRNEKPSAQVFRRSHRFAVAVGAPLFVRNTNRRSAAMTRMGGPRNCSKHQITKWSQKRNSARHHASVRNRCFARAKTTAATRRKSRRHRLARGKTTLRGGCVDRRFARRPKTPGARAK